MRDVKREGDALAARARAFARAFIAEAKTAGLPAPATPLTLEQWLATAFVAGSDRSDMSIDALARALVAAAQRAQNTLQ